MRSHVKRFILSTILNAIMFGLFLFFFAKVIL